MKRMTEIFFYNPYTHPDYWNCECKEDYINPKKLIRCIFCGAHKEDQPDSILEEVNECYGNS